MKQKNWDRNNLHNKSRQAALKEIAKMVEMEIVKREGQARANYYVMR